MHTVKAGAQYPADHYSATAELHNKYPGASGFYAQIICQSDELRKEDKFIEALVQALSKRSALVNMGDMASMQKMERDKQKVALVKKVFQADYNGDGKISLDEVQKYEQMRQRGFNQLPKRSDGVRTDLDNPAARVAQTMINDTNKDGVIEYNELMAANGFSTGGPMNRESQKQALSQQYTEQKKAEKDKLTQDARKAFAAVDINKDHTHSKGECDAYTQWQRQLSSSR